MLWIGLGAYFITAFAYLGLRYWVAPRIDDWRPYLTEQFSQRFGVAISVGHLSLAWSGSGPAFLMQDVQLRDEGGGRVLTLPKVQGRLSWQGLWHGEASFQDLELDGLELAVHRDKDHRLTLFSDSVVVENDDSQSGQDDEGVGLGHPLVQWLSRQARVVFRDASLVWSDDTRDGRPLTLDKVTLAWLSDGQRYRLGLAGEPVGDIGERFLLKGEFTQTDMQAAVDDPQAWDARLYIDIQDVVPQAWRAWVDIPEQMASGRLNAQWWLDVVRGAPSGMALQAELTQGSLKLSETESVDVAAARLRVQGDWRAYMALYQAATDPDPDPDPEAEAEAEPASAAAVALALELRGLKLDLPEVFEHSLEVDELTLRGSLKREAHSGMALQLRQARVVNGDMDASLAGEWRRGAPGTAGWVDLHGRFERASMAAIQRYLPLTVEADARDWMRTGLLAGQVRQADFLMRGVVDDFPFGDERSPDVAGAWRLDGRYENAIIDYVPPEGKRKGWPRLEGVSGRVSMRGNDLRVVADEAVAYPEPGKAIRLYEVQAHIPNLARQTTLNLQGRTEAGAEAYLALMRVTPLGGWLGNTFDETRGEGDWRMPLRLTIPLLDADASRVRGQLRLHDARLQLFDTLPEFEKVKGELDFSEWGVTIQGLEARFLGGAMSVRGGLGKGQTALGAVGHADVAAIKQAFDLMELKQLSGELDYRVRLERTRSGRYGLTLQSDLQGLAAALPAPMAKPAQSRWPVTVSWQPQGRAEAMTLDVDLGARGQARFAHDPAREQSYFHTAAIGLGRSAALPSQGLAVDVQAERLDMAAWERLINGFPAAKPGARRRAIWPALEDLRVQAGQLRMWGLDMDHATLTARQEARGQWRLDLSSTQTAGTLFWREAQDMVAGKVQAHFARLAIDPGEDEAGAAGQHDEDDWSLDDDLDLPGVQLQVDDLVIGGRHLGKLSLDGINVSRGRLWRLDALSLKSPSASLSGQGEWRLDGQERGLSLSAQAEVMDAGGYLKQIGLDEVLQGGKGKLDLQLQWRHLPWRFDVKDVQGSVKLALQDGRFSAVQSRTVKLLELLSMQSLQRMLSLDLRPGAMFSKGFPFDSWSGTLHMDQGVIQTNDYRIEGAAGTISLSGSTRWLTEELDLQAMVVPKLDVSGASLAAGFVVNPVVGLGAFLTQWMLKEPLARAMTVHYEVKGTWKEPKMREVSVSEAASQAQAEAASEEGVNQ